MIKFDSIKEWKNYCLNNHKLYIENVHFTRWIKEKTICIFNYSSIKKEDIKNIKHGIEKAIAAIGLDFKLKYQKYKLDNLGNAVENGSIISGVLLKMAKASRKQSHGGCASIFVFDKPIKSPDAVLKYGEALTYVPEGITMFAFDALKKYSPKFLRCRAMHETFHLLGLNVHHEETQVQGCKQSVSCNMEYNAPSEKLCQKCKDGLLSFWKGIEYATKKLKL